MFTMGCDQEGHRFSGGVYGLGIYTAGGADRQNAGERGWQIMRCFAASVCAASVDLVLRSVDIQGERPWRKAREDG